jgi:hypothetical protein
MLEQFMSNRVRGVADGGSSRCVTKGMAAVLFSTLVQVGCDSNGNIPVPIDGSSASSEDANQTDAFRMEEVARSPDGPTKCITGRVLDLNTKIPLGGRTVVSNGTRTTTDPINGEFGFDCSTTPYDLVIVDPDGSTVSVYRGLARHDPVLLHPASPEAQSGALHARVHGNMSAPGIAFPLTGQANTISAFLFASHFENREFLGASSGPTGPDYVLPVAWDGPASLDGTVFALGTFAADDGGPGEFSASSFTQTLTLVDGDDKALDLPLSPVPIGHISGTIVAPSGTNALSAIPLYRFSFPGAAFSLPNANVIVSSPATVGGPFELVAPDLSGSGARLCISARGDLNGRDELYTERCGITLGGDAGPITLQDPPSITVPTPRSTIDVNTQFSWTPFPEGIYEIALGAAEPSSASPNIYIFTTGSAISWSDLLAVGVDFPRGASYTLQVGGLGRYQGIDDAVGPSGIGAFIPTEARRSFAPSIELTTAP